MKLQMMDILKKMPNDRFKRLCKEHLVIGSGGKKDFKTLKTIHSVLLNANNFKARYNSLAGSSVTLFDMLINSSGILSREDISEEQGKWGGMDLEKLLESRLAFVLKGEKGKEMVHVPHDYLFMEGVRVRDGLGLVSGIRAYSGDAILKIANHLRCSHLTNKAGRSSDIYHHVIKNTKKLLDELSKEERAVFDTVLEAGGMISSTSFAKRYKTDMDPYFYYNWGMSSDELVGSSVGSRNIGVHIPLFRKGLLIPASVSSGWNRHAGNIVIPNEVMETVGKELIQGRIRDLEKKGEEAISRAPSPLRFLRNETSYFDDLVRMSVYMSSEKVRLKADHTPRKKDMERMVKCLGRTPIYLFDILRFLLINGIIAMEGNRLDTTTLAEDFFSKGPEGYYNTLQDVLVPPRREGPSLRERDPVPLKVRQYDGDAPTFNGDLVRALYPSLKRLGGYGKKGILYPIFLKVLRFDRRNLISEQMANSEPVRREMEGFDDHDDLDDHDYFDDLDDYDDYADDIDDFTNYLEWSHNTLADLFWQGLIDIGVIPDVHLPSNWDGGDGNLEGSGLPDKCVGCEHEDECKESSSYILHDDDCDIDDDLEDEMEPKGHLLVPRPDSGKKEDGTMVLRLSEVGRALIGRKAPPPSYINTVNVGKGGGSIVLKPDMEIIAASGTAFSVLKDIGTFSKIRSMDRVFIFGMDKNSIIEGMERGLDIDLIKGLLSRHSRKPIPQNILALFDEIENRTGEIEIGECYGYIKAKDRYQAMELQRTKTLSKHIGRVLGDDIILIRTPGSLGKVYDILKKKGHIPKRKDGKEEG